MNELKYDMPNDIHTYVITCPIELLDMYMELIFENGAYRVNLNNKVFFGSLSTFKEWKEVNVK